MKKALSKDEFVKRAIAELTANNKLAKVILPSPVLKIKRTTRRKKYNGFEVVERTALYG